MKRAAFRCGWIAAALIGAASVPAGAEIYHWTDAAGHEHFTSDPAQAPLGALHPARGAREGTLNGGSAGALPRSATPPPASAGPAGSAAGSAGAAAGTGAAAPSGDTAGGHDEAWWHEERGRQLREVEALDAKVASCKNAEAPADDKSAEAPRGENAATDAPAEQRGRDRRASAREACNEATVSLETKKREFENFEENARQQGVPPGWLR
jgi:hypothetical protein